MTLMALGFLGCNGGSQFTYTGYQITDHFPLDGARSWKYSQDDKAIKWLLEVDKILPTTMSGAIEIVTLEYSRGDTGDLLYAIDWSSDSNNGVLIHRFERAGGKSQTFDPPIVFGKYQMTSGDTITTDTNGGSFTSTFLGIEGCGNHWVADWECAHMELSGPGIGFEGDYWIAPRYGTSLFKTVDDEQNWTLLTAEWDENTTPE